MRYLSGYEMFANVMIDFTLARWADTPPPLIPKDVAAAKNQVQGSGGKNSESKNGDGETKYTDLTRRNLRRVKKRAGALLFPGNQTATCLSWRRS
mmetsp:Transcript_110499/g.191509  ORF Transcript_110499/g.191509 Transcript_110499/m.191509 type:complete len:95 (+) Transcript_110499:302-586(+)